MARRSSAVSDEEEWEEEDEWETEDDGEEWEEDEDEEWDEEDDEWAPSGWDEDGDGRVSAAEVTRTVSFGFVSMVPLLVLYEWSYLSVSQGVDGGPRSVAEALLSAPLAPFGDGMVHSIRRAGLATVAVVTLVVSLRRDWAIGPRLMRVFFEGCIGAIALGPILAVAARLTQPYVGAMVVGTAEGVPPLTRAGLVMGGAAYEELAFRVLALALIFVVMRRFLSFFGMGGRIGGWLAALGSASLSALLFSAFHLEAMTMWLGPGGEDFDAAVFTWRLAAGMLLALVVLWRGVGVAAWSHALFNLALLIGIKPPTIT